MAKPKNEALEAELALKYAMLCAEIGEQPSETQQEILTLLTAVRNLYMQHPGKPCSIVTELLKLIKDYADNGLEWPGGGLEQAVNPKAEEGDNERD